MENKDFYRIVGINIQSERRRKKMTQEELANMLGVTSRSVCNYENGRNITLILIHNLAKIFNCKTDDFLLGTEYAKCVD